MLEAYGRISVDVLTPRAAKNERSLSAAKHVASQGIHADASHDQMRIHCMSCNAQSTMFFLGTVVPVFSHLLMGPHVAYIPSNDKRDKRTA